jgi:hypothetical protein
MTWNVENLFRPGTQAAPTTATAYEQKLTGLARVINEQAPDALAVQEIGDPAALDDLIGLLAGTWQRQLSTPPDGRGIRVGWLTRRPISDPAEVLDFPPPLRPVQVDDAGSTLGQMGRDKVLVTPLTAVTAQAVIEAPLPSIDPADPNGRRNEPSSDHAPVVATFTNL